MQVTNIASSVTNSQYYCMIQPSIATVLLTDEAVLYGCYSSHDNYCDITALFLRQCLGFRDVCQM